MPYAPANALTVLDNAVNALRAERDAAAGDAPAISAMLEQAAARVAAGREKVAGAVQSTSWTAERAVNALAATVPARAENGRAIVELPPGGRLLIEPFAQAVRDNPRPGYAVSIIGARGDVATRLRAADDPALVSVVGRLYGGAV